MRGCRSLLCIAALTSFPAAAAEPAPSQTPPSHLIQALGTLYQVVDALTRHVEEKNLSLIHDEDMRLYASTSVLISNDQLATMEKTEEITLGWVVFSRGVADLHAAADAFRQEESAARLKTVRAKFDEMARFYDPATLAAARSLADRHTCPMHFDILGARTDLCPKCGMVLSLPARVSMFQAGYIRPAPHTVTASIRTEGDLTPGVRSNAWLTLTSLDGAPIPSQALREVHTQKIHLLIIDSSLTDYHHEHPVESGVPGQYGFSFVPRKPGAYRAWADLQPYASGFQEYAMAGIPAASCGEPPGGKTDASRGLLEGLRYDLVFYAQDGVRAGHPVMGRLRIVEAEGGAPFGKLEPLMGAFAHLVGFHEDRETVLHMHPRGSQVLTAQDRGGPDLDFQLYTENPGFYRLFAQVQIGGVSKFIPFGLTVVP